MKSEKNIERVKRKIAGKNEEETLNGGSVEKGTSDPREHPVAPCV